MRNTENTGNCSPFSIWGEKSVSRGLNSSECIGIEDAEAGIEAIHSAGMVSVGVGSAIPADKADIVLGSTAELSLSSII